MKTTNINFSFMLIMALIGAFTFVAPTASLAQLVSQAASDVTRPPEFRIATQLFVGDSEQPQAHNLTLFSKGVVYDFQHGPNKNEPAKEVVIFNSRTKKVILLNLETEKKLEIYDVSLMKLVDEMRLAAEKQPQTRFLVQDQYKETIDTETKSVSLKSDIISYRFEGKTPANETIMPVYFEFLDTFTRLQASDPQKLSPLPRIRLNQSIRRVGWIPTRVDIDVKQNAMFRQPFIAHTEHRLTAGLTAIDQEKIIQAKRQWTQFKSVSLAEYRGFPPAPKLPLFRSANAKNGNNK